jgi:uncharacterized protein YeeX (DUF496 family)
MADTTDISVHNSFNSSCDINAATNCENCTALQNYLHNLTMELESANLIIKFLHEGANTTVDSKGIKAAQTDKKDRDISNNKGITVTNNSTYKFQD